jgi:hypothetical protein
MAAPMVQYQDLGLFRINDMRIRFGEKWTRKLADLPETSMGSQHVDITLKGNRIIRDVPVFNAQECQSPEAFDPSDIIDVQLHVTE